MVVVAGVNDDYLNKPPVLLVADQNAKQSGGERCINAVRLTHANQGRTLQHNNLRRAIAHNEHLCKCTPHVSYHLTALQYNTLWFAQARECVCVYHGRGWCRRRCC